MRRVFRRGDQIGPPESRPHLHRSCAAQAPDNSSRRPRGHRIAQPYPLFCGTPYSLTTRHAAIARYVLQMQGRCAHARHTCGSDAIQCQCTVRFGVSSATE